MWLMTVFFLTAVICGGLFLLGFPKGNHTYQFRQAIRNGLFSCCIAMGLCGILILAIVYDIEGRSPMEYQNYVIFCEEFDLVASNDGTVTQRLKDKVLDEAKGWNDLIDMTTRERKGLLHDFRMKDFDGAPKILTEKLGR